MSFSGGHARNAQEQVLDELDEDLEHREECYEFDGSRPVYANGWQRGIDLALQALLPKGKAPKHQCVVYFIRTVGLPFVKIGQTTDLVQRLASIQTGNHEEVRVMGTIPGGIAEERALHARFDALRIRPGNEWFHLRDDLEALALASVVTA